MTPAADDHTIHCARCGAELRGAALVRYVAGLEQERADAEAKRDGELKAVGERYLPRPFVDSTA